MKKDYDKILLILFVGILIGLIVTMVFMSNWFYQIPYSIQFKINGYTKENALAVCSGKNLEKTALCLNSFVKGIYHYVPTRSSRGLNFEKIVKEGNDCDGYTFVYETLFNGLGFESEKVSVSVEKRDSIFYYHIWLVAYDETGRCSLDQKHIDCSKYGK